MAARILLIPFLVVAGLLLIALLLPSKGDTSVAAWWARVRYQALFSLRVVLALLCVAVIIRFVLLPMFGW